MTSLPPALTPASVASYADTWLAFRRRLLRVPGVQAAIWYGDGPVLSTAASGRPRRPVTRRTGWGAGPGTARSVVDALARGADVTAACRDALRDAADLPDPFRTELRVLALTPDGRHGGAAGAPGATYSVMTTTSTAPETHPRSVL